MPDRRFGFVLPDDWQRIPLVDPEARDKAIKHFVDKQVPRTDQLARVRHELRDEIRQQCERSAQIGGIVSAIFLKPINDVTLRANMTCYDVSRWMPQIPGVDPIRIMAHWVGDKPLEDSRPPIGPPATPPGTTPPEVPNLPDDLPQRGTSKSPLADAPWAKVEKFDILAYRRDVVAPASAYFGEAFTKFDQLRVEYISWVPEFGLVQTAFGTPFPTGRDAWLQLFDAIIASYRVPGSVPSSPSTTSEKE